MSDEALAVIADGMGVEPAALLAVRDVESNGQAFDPMTLRPIILFEPHVFSRLTRNQFDDIMPNVSYRVWKTRPYPPSQSERWIQMTYAYQLDPAAALQAASWGMFQIMGFHWKRCGCGSAFDFANRMATDQAEQVKLLIAWLDSNGKAALKAKNWLRFATLYNGTGQAEAYAAKLKAAYEKRKA